MRHLLQVLLKRIRASLSSRNFRSLKSLPWKLLAIFRDNSNDQHFARPVIINPPKFPTKMCMKKLIIPENADVTDYNVILSVFYSHTRGSSYRHSSDLC